MKELQKRLVDPRTLGDPMRVMLSRMTLVINRRVKRKTPVDTGTLRNKIVNEVDSSIIPQWASIGVNLPYAAPVEFGSRPHFPPLAPLLKWVKRHGSGGKAKSMKAARNLQQAIGRRGTKGAHMFRDGLEDSQAGIRREVQRAQRSIAAKIKGI